MHMWNNGSICFPPCLLPAQVLTMESERFTLPEVLFHPSDIGINQMGVVEATGEAIKCLREVSPEKAKGGGGTGAV